MIEIGATGAGLTRALPWKRFFVATFVGCFALIQVLFEFQRTIHAMKSGSEGDVAILPPGKSIHGIFVAGWLAITPSQSTVSTVRSWCS